MSGADVMNLCQEHRDAHRGKPLSRRDKQIGKREEHRSKARMDHCALMEVLYYALCGIPGGSRGELMEYPTSDGGSRNVWTIAAKAD